MTPIVKLPIESKKKQSKSIVVSMKGGPGSGHFGHAGRPGQVGGSQAGSGGGLSTFNAKFSDIEGSIIDNGTDPKLDDLFNSTVKGLPSGASHISEYWNAASIKQRQTLKKNVVDDISKEVEGVEDLSESDVADYVNQWAQTSNNNDMRSFSLQEAAAEEFSEFGVELSEWQNNKLQLNTNFRGSGPKSRPLNSMSRNEERALVRATYDNTQKWFKDNGYEPDDKITIFRGLSSTEPFVQGELVNYRGNAIESWSISGGVATEFANSSINRNTGVVMAMDVPIKRVFSTPFSGIGCLTEGEIVIFGNAGNDSTATVIDGNSF